MKILSPVPLKQHLKKTKKKVIDFQPLVYVKKLQHLPVWLSWDFLPAKKYRVNFCGLLTLYTAISRKVVGKSAHDSTERYCGWLWGHCSSEKFERMVHEATDICLRVLKESNKSRFNSFSRYEQCSDHKVQRKSFLQLALRASWS